MALTEYRHGALYVVRDDRDQHDLRRALRQIDERLFFEQQITFDNEPVWCVCVDIGGDQPPVTILEYRDEKRRPIPYLDSGVIERMSQMERDGSRLADTVIERNTRMLAERREHGRREYEEIARDMIPRVYGKTRPVLPRSQALRMSRDKRRGRGENV